MYKVLVAFRDLEDPSQHIYQPGDTFPRDGVKPTKGRIMDLASNKNKLKQPLIEKV